MNIMNFEFVLMIVLLGVMLLPVLHALFVTTLHFTYDLIMH